MTAEASSPLSLDVVRARIFYLACDVEPASPPAAMLLRAVADAIQDSEGEIRLGDAGSADDQITSLFAQVGMQHLVGGSPRPGAPNAERRLAVVASQFGQKR